MSKTQVSEIQLGNLKVQGLSRAGTGTSLFLPEFKICFDVAQGWPFHYASKHFFITHSHMDHAGGIPYIISQRGLMNLPEAQFYMPEAMIEPMHEILKQWQKIEGHTYQYSLNPLPLDKEVEVKPNYFVRSFKTQHRVDSQGYALIQKKKKLKPEYLNLCQQTLVDLKNSGTKIHEYIEEIEFAFTGDTKIEFLDASPWVKNSKVLFMEVTYFDEKSSIERARTWGHIHFEELLPRLAEIKSNHLVLTHISTKYSHSKACEILEKKVRLKADLERLHIF